MIFSLLTTYKLDYHPGDVPLYPNEYDRNNAGCPEIGDFVVVTSS